MSDNWHAIARSHTDFSTNDFHNELFSCSLNSLYESFNSDIKHASAFMFRYTVTTNTPETSRMATNTTNSTFNATQEKVTTPGLGASQCITWLVVLITECLATVILNIITIIVFVKQHQLQRRSTYLIIHLAFVDFLVGAVSGPLTLAGRMATFCHLWKDPFRQHAPYMIQTAFTLLLYFISILNLAVISLERLHATLCPLKHRLLGNWNYAMVICAMWVFSAFVEFVPLILYTVEKLNAKWLSLFYNIRSSLCLLVLLVICVSYILIYLKVHCGPNLQHHGAANREKQLTVTLVAVTIVSLVTWMPAVILFILVFSNGTSYHEMFDEGNFHLAVAFTVLITANSLVNPIMYAVRMAEFRKIVCQLFQRYSGRREAHDIIQLNNRIE